MLKKSILLLIFILVCSSVVASGSGGITVNCYLDYASGTVDVSGESPFINKDMVIEIYKIIGTQEKLVNADQITTDTKGEYSISMSLVGGINASASLDGSYKVYASISDSDYANSTFTYDANLIMQNTVLLVNPVYLNITNANVVVSGLVKTLDSKTVSLQIKDPQGNIIITDNTTSNTNGIFNFAKLFPNNVFVSGVYKANVYVLGQSASTALDLSFNVDVSKILPVAEEVSIIGGNSVGSVLAGNYTYKHRYDEYGSTFKWLRSSSINGTYAQVGTELNYQVSKSDAGMYLKFEVTPKCLTAPTTGISYSSSPLFISTSGTTGGTGSSGKTTTIINTPLLTEQPQIGINKFTDVPSTHWASDDINYMVDNGFVNGIGNYQFGPDVDITRAEFVALISRMLKIGDEIYQNGFNDVSADMWYANSIESVSQAKLISGFNGNFRPNDKITREEITKIVLEAYKYKGGKEVSLTNSIEFVDSNQISDWALESVTMADNLGFIKGEGENKFAPQANATRAQAVTILKRLHLMLIAN